ncbi:MAG: VWA domain-containing protein [Bacteroidia bacterium]|nr:VWA domain-containing protein [Bacteroidia bacterium]
MRLALFFAVLLSLSYHPNSRGLLAQTPGQHDARIHAINRYVDFSNECQHLLYEFRIRVEELNRQGVGALQDKHGASLTFRTDDFVRGTKLFTFLQGTCARTSSEVDAGVDLAVLYQRTQVNNPLSAAEKSKLTPPVDQIWSLTLGLLDLGQRMILYVERGQQTDPELVALFLLLEEAKQTYEKMDTQVQILRNAVGSLVPPPPPALQAFHTLTSDGESLLHAIRHQNQAGITAARAALQQSIQASKEAKLTYRSQLQSLGIWFNEEEQAYDHAVEYGELILARSSSAALAGSVRIGYALYPPAYYHFNERLLAVYNHHKYGLTPYYNHLLDQANQEFVRALEVTPWLMILYPVQKKEVPIVSQPIDPPRPNTPVFTLEAAPVNNLVFLIDVSASMNNPDKLPVLKENMEFLVSLFRPEDKIAIVTFAGEATVALESTAGIFTSEIKTAIRNLRTSGETKARKGFREAYRIAEENYIFNGTNRVILITDGIFETDRSIESSIAQFASSGIMLSVMLIGKNEATPVATRLSQLARLGEGRYSHLRKENAKEVMVTEARGE